MYKPSRKEATPHTIALTTTREKLRETIDTKFLISKCRNKYLADFLFCLVLK